VVLVVTLAVVVGGNQYTVHSVRAVGACAEVSAPSTSPHLHSISRYYLGRQLQQTLNRARSDGSGGSRPRKAMPAPPQAGLSPTLASDFKEETGCAGSQEESATYQPPYRCYARSSERLTLS
jgi:hypothetical protein